MDNMVNQILNVFNIVANNGDTSKEFPDDALISGYNEFGSPILYSPKNGVSVEWIIMDWSL